MDYGMAEYRNGHYLVANEAFKAAMLVAEAPTIQRSCGFFRAMSLFRLGQKVEAGQLFAETAK